MVHRLTVVSLVAVSSLAFTASALASPSPSSRMVHRTTQRHLGATHMQATTAVPAVAPPPLYVNGATGTDTGNNCLARTHPCQTIGYALGAASLGATINVAKGTYPEQLTVTRNVTIKGAGSGATIIEPTSLTTSEIDTDSNTPQAVIVYFSPSVTSGTLANLQVNGTAASASFTDCSTDYVGVYYRDASGTVSGVKVTGIQQSHNAFGCQPGANGGVLAATDSSQTAPTNGTGSAALWVPPPTGWANSTVGMGSVVVNNYDKDGITCSDPGTTCNINLSTVTGSGPIPTNANPWENTAQNGIEVYGANASISNTTVSGNSYTNPGYTGSGYSTSASGILVINAGTFTLTGSTVKKNDLNVYLLWYPPFGSVPPGGQGAWTITGNKVSYGTNNSGTVSGSTPVPFGYGLGDGIDLDGPTGVTVGGNTVAPRQHRRLQR